MKKLIVLITCIFASHAFAQQQQASPEQQAIQGKLMEEYNQNLALRTALIKEQMKVKELEEKLAKATTKEGGK